MAYITESEALDAVISSNPYCRRYATNSGKPCVICGTRNNYMIENILLSDFNNPQCAHEGECQTRARNRPRGSEVGREHASQ